jgi:hypothetical protein
MASGAIIMVGSQVIAFRIYRDYSRSTAQNTSASDYGFFPGTDS